MLDPVPAAGLEPDEKKGGDHMSDIKGEYGLFIDYEYCSGCNACLTACKMEHDMPESDFGIRIFQDGPVQYLSLIHICIPTPSSRSTPPTPPQWAWRKASGSR